MLLIFIFLISNDVKNLFMYFIIHISFVKFLFKVFAYFSVGLFLLLLVIRNLYIFQTKAFLLGICFVSISIQRVCLFKKMLFFNKQKPLTFKIQFVNYFLL